MDRQIPEIAISYNNGQTEIVFSCNDIKKTDKMLCRNDGLADGVSCVYDRLRQNVLSLLRTKR